MEYEGPRSPASEEEWKGYYLLRYNVLRKPWNQALGSEKDDSEDSSFHLGIWKEKQCIAVGRLQVLESGNTCQIRYMAVDPEYQGMKLGREILRGLINQAVEWKKEFIILHAREQVIKFYENEGFCVVEPSYLLFDTIQHYLMKKTLVLN